MENILEIVRVNKNEDNWSQLRQLLEGSKADILNLTTQVENNRTMLQSGIEELLNSRLVYGAGILLSYHTDNLHEAFDTIFSTQAIAYFSNAVKPIIMKSAEEVSRISRKLVYIHCKEGTSRDIIQVLFTTVGLLAPTPVCLTPLHAHILQACVSAQMFSIAVRMLKKSQILQINPQVTCLNQTDYLTYFYYSGICYSAVKEFLLAIDSYFQIIITPAKVVSAYAVAALKKLKLLNLIVNGTAFDVPKHAPSIIARYMSEDFKNYDAIVQAFVKRDKSRLESLISTHEILLKSDRNWGLINELMSSYTRYLIKDLSMTYTSLSLRDMIRYCHMNNFDDIEKILFEMVKTDEITVQIDRENEIIRFDPIHDEKNTVGDQRESSEQLHMTLQQHLKLTSVLMERIGEIRNEMITSSAYVKRSLTMKK